MGGGGIEGQTNGVWTHGATAAYVKWTCPDDPFSGHSGKREMHASGVQPPSRPARKGKTVRSPQLSPLQQLHTQSAEPHGGGGGGWMHGVTSRTVAVLLSPAPRDVGLGHWKKRWAHSADEQVAPSPEVNLPSGSISPGASRHPCAALQHEHMQSLPPHGGGGGQAVDSSKLAMTLPGVFAFAGSAIDPSEGHLHAIHARGEHQRCFGGFGAWVPKQRACRTSTSKQPRHTKRVNQR